MIIEIRGVTFRGHGAELMMRAIIDHFGERDVQFAISPTGSYRNRAKYGFLQKTPPLRFRRSGLATLFMTKSYRANYGLVRDNDIDAVLDASGFAYGDQWGPADSEELCRATRRWKSQNRDKRVILLPQAFGPFSDPKVRAAFADALQRVDLAFARDTESLGHLRALSVADRQTALAPDFTCDVAPAPTACDGRFAAIAPNVRMLDMTDPASGEAYVRFLKRAVEELASRDIEPVMITHEGSADDRLVTAVNELLDKQIRHIRSADPLHLKAVIGKSRLLIGSRFHALVSGLSQGVPCIGTGWSHKYRHLFEDYDCVELLVSPSAQEQLPALLDRVLCDESRASLILRLQDCGRRQRERTTQMWSQVDACLGVA